ncbi:Uncharacterised protein [Vibrio cholerae]|nr:Uncharacterised protein [Vibrio cholerae]
MACSIFSRIAHFICWLGSALVLVLRLIARFLAL